MHPQRGDRMLQTRVEPIEAIAETGLLLPDLILRGLAAGDRLKYYITLLQAAYSHAHAADQPVPNLRVQREASGVIDATLDRMIESSVARGSDTVYIPGAVMLMMSMFDEARRMLHPLVLSGIARSELGDRVEVYQPRIENLYAHAPLCADDLVTRSAMSVLTRLTENGHDTMHQLMLDLRWELNR